MGQTSMQGVQMQLPKKYRNEAFLHDVCFSCAVTSLANISC